MNQKARRLQMNEDTVIPIPLDSEGNVVNRSISGMYNSGIRLVSAFAYNETGECTIPTLTGNKRDYENHVFINGEPLTLTYTKYKAKIIYVNSITGGDIADQTTGALRGPVETGAGTQENPYVNLNTALRLAECYVKTTCGCFVCIKLKGTVDYQIFAKGTTCGVITGEQRVLVEAWDSAEKPIINPKLGFIRYINASQARLEQNNQLYLISVSSMYFRNIEFVWNYVDNFKNETDALTDSSNESAISKYNYFQLLYGLNCCFESCTFTEIDADYQITYMSYRWLRGYRWLINSSIHYTGHHMVAWCDVNNMGHAKGVTLITDQPFGIIESRIHLGILCANILDGFSSNNFMFDAHYTAYEDYDPNGTVAVLGYILCLRSIGHNIQLHNCNIIGATSLQDYTDMGYSGAATFELIYESYNTGTSLELYNSTFEYQYKGGAIYYSSVFNIRSSCDWRDDNDWSTMWNHCSRIESCEFNCNHLRLTFYSVYDCNITFVGDYWIGEAHDFRISAVHLEKTNVTLDDTNITYIDATATDNDKDTDGRYRGDAYYVIYVAKSIIDSTFLQTFGTNTATWFATVYTAAYTADHRLEDSTIITTIEGYIGCYLSSINTGDIVTNNHFSFTQTVSCPATMTHNMHGGINRNSWIYYDTSYINDDDVNVPAFLFANNQITFTRTRTVPQTEDIGTLRSIYSDIILVSMGSFPTSATVSNNSISGSVSESWAGYYDENRCTYYDDTDDTIKGSGGVVCNVDVSIKGISFTPDYWQLTGFTISVSANAACTASKDPTCSDLTETEVVCQATGEVGQRRQMRYYAYNGDVQIDETATTDYTCN
nr:MAG TPA: hypothetical protein [Herelleviridae sp.]